MLLWRHPWLCVETQEPHKNLSAGGAELLQPEQGEVPGNSAAPSRSGSREPPPVPTKVRFHLLCCTGGDGGTFSGFHFPGTESGLVPQLLHQPRKRKGMLLSFPDTGRGFGSNQAGADTFPSPWLPA